MSLTCDSFTDMLLLMTLLNTDNLVYDSTVCTVSDNTLRKVDNLLYDSDIDMVWLITLILPMSLTYSKPPWNTLDWNILLWNSLSVLNCMVSLTLLIHDL